MIRMQFRRSRADTSMCNRDTTVPPVRRCYWRLFLIPQPSRVGQQEEIMNARHTLGLLIVAVLALSALGNDAVGQQKTLKEQLIGTWTSVSVVETTADGSKIDRWGPHA